MEGLGCERALLRCFSMVDSRELEASETSAQLIRYFLSM